MKPGLKKKKTEAAFTTRRKKLSHNTQRKHKEDGTVKKEMRKEKSITENVETKRESWESRGRHPNFQCRSRIIIKAAMQAGLASTTA